MKKQSFLKLGESIKSLPQKHKQLLIGIDGGSGAGKSTFAEHLSGEFADSHIVHIDDFYKGLPHKGFEFKEHDVSPNFDWDRLEAEVIEPIREGREVSYGIFSWHTNKIDKSEKISTNAVVIIEGLEVIQHRFNDVYDYKIWIDCDIDLRLERGVERDGEEMHSLWANYWLPFDEHYRDKQKTRERADLIVDGEIPYFETGEFTTKSQTIV